MTPTIVPLRHRRWERVALSIAGWALVTVCVGLAMVPLYGQVNGSFRLLPVLSDSMAPEMVRGDLAWVEPKPTRQLAVGDVLVFNSPVRGSTPSRRVIHRIIEIVDPATIREADRRAGAVYVRTKGDANPDPDPWIASVRSETVYVRTKIVPNLGKPLLAGGSSVRVIALVAAGLLLAAFGISALRSGPAPEPVSTARKPRDDGRSVTYAAVATPASTSPPKLRPSTTATSPPAARRSPAPVQPTNVPPPVRSPRRFESPLGGSVVVGAIAAVLVGATGVAAAVSALLAGNATQVDRIATGAVVLEIGRPRPLAVEALLPGEWSHQVVELRNTGSVPLGRLQLEVTGASSPLVDPTTGLQLTVTSCSAAWQASADGRAAVCPGTERVLVPERPVLGRSELALEDVQADIPGATDHLRISLRLPEEAPAGVGDGAASIDLVVLGSQRRGTLR